MSGLPMFSAASLFRTKHNTLKRAYEATFFKPLTLFMARLYCVFRKL